MAKQIINIGTQANDGTGDNLRTAFTKANQNFTELYNIQQSSTIDGVARSTANSATNLAQSAYNYANTIVARSIDQYARTTANAAINSINIIQGVNTTQNTNITTVTNLAQAAFNQANTGGNANTGDIVFTDDVITSTTDRIVIGDTNANLTVNEDLRIVKMSFISSDSSGFAGEYGNWTSATWTDYEITINEVDNQLLQFVDQFYRYTTRSISINGGAPMPIGGWNNNGSTISFTVDTLAPANPTAVTEINFLTTFDNRILLDADEGDYGVWLDDFNFNINVGRDIRLEARDDISIQGADSFQLRNTSTTDPIRIATDYNNNNYEWQFTVDAEMLLPRGGEILEGLSPSGLGRTIELVPDGGSNADQRLKIYPTAAEGNHLHLTTGNLYNTELYLGDDNLYVKLTNAGDVVVNANNGDGLTAQWIFDTTGALTLPPSNEGPGGSGFIQTLDSYPTLLAYGAGGHGGPELDWTDTDNLNDLFNNNTVLRHTMYLNSGGLYIGINENEKANVFSGAWLFGTDGALTLPGKLTFPDSSMQTSASISISELKALVANTTTYDDFKSAIAAL